MLFPIIKVKDQATNSEHIVGTDIHDQLIVDKNGESISYFNLKNGEGTDGDYSFFGKYEEGQVYIEFVTFNELSKIHAEYSKADISYPIDENRKELLVKNGNFVVKPMPDLNKLSNEELENRANMFDDLFDFAFNKDVNNNM